ncbi:replication protein A 32 kDa subunit B isoform X2 [Helianthus annuus]|uniref:replication protein A 32 kDa subunit B isoform X2 n=1 Tax=Helianthus annuus TaxID=4232 RepID=UPI000B8F5258|nr:replication protein A 32 kDa subunit B isoform X2 [Helianthus annuus]
MYDNEFDGTAAFSGGGFMPPPAAQTADPSPSVFTEKRDAKRLLPLTVNQINDGVDVNNVKLVGMVLNKAEGSVNEIRFVLDDGTGRIDCLKWVNEPVDIKEMEPIMEGVYVRVHGQVKELQGKKHLMVFGIKPVTDFDEITVTHHFVECIDVHSYNTRLMKQQAGTSNQTHMPGSAVNTHAYQTATSNQFTGPYGASDGLSGIDKMVLDYLMQSSSVDGVHQEELVNQLDIPLDKILAALNTLVDEGLIYNSVDEYHFKSTFNV